MYENLRLRIAPADINYFNRIMEGYEYLGAVTTLDRRQGIVIVRTTPDTYVVVKDILAHLPIEFSYID